MLIMMSELAIFDVLGCQVIRGRMLLGSVGMTLRAA